MSAQASAQGGSPLRYEKTCGYKNQKEKSPAPRWNQGEKERRRVANQWMRMSITSAKMITPAKKTMLIGLGGSSSHAGARP